MKSREKIATSNSSDNPPALARALEYLAAVEVAPGRYAHYDVGEHRYYVVDERALARLAERIEECDRLDAAAGDEIAKTHAAAARCNLYLVWYRETDSVEMPLWWSPTRREAWCLTSSLPWPHGRWPAETYASEREASSVVEKLRNTRVGTRTESAEDVRVQHITASLESGGELPV